MKAITFQEVESVSYESVPEPEIRAPGEVILRVRLSAICGSDLHVYHGRETGLDRGTVMGHEMLGEVVEAGPSVRRFAVGDTVVCPFTTSCGDCFFCREGLTARCAKGQLFGWVEEGEGLHGGQAEYARVPLADSTLVAIPDGAPIEEALLAGDILSTGFFCADRAEVKPGSTVAVVGCGPVGLMAIVAARELGAEKIFAFDSLGERLSLAAGFGAQPLDHLQSESLEVVREATEGRGVDAVLEAVGSPEATRLAIDVVRAGGTISAAGVHTEPRHAFSPVEAYDKNLTYRTGRCPARAYIDRVLPLVRAQAYDLATIISHRLPLAEGVRGYELFARRLDGCTKVILAP
ncbi:MAG: alcohol dehydrogenase [Acidobacteria bacterium]|nr:MAG: alcohol dehydrogenase [Acidobacteriota bacterium]